MDDFGSSESSWKKMVIAKTNNKWISTIKEEQREADIVNTTIFSLGEEHVPFANIKNEQDESTERRFQVTDGSLAMMQDMDPLSTDEPQRRRRRKGSGPKNESPDERAARLAKMSAYAAQRLANETAEQRSVRLRRMSEYAAKRLAQETSEQRAKRLARMSAYAAKRLATETPEQRQARLTRMSAYAARRQAMKKITGSAASDIQSNYDMMNIMPNQS